MKANLKILIDKKAADLNPQKGIDTTVSLIIRRLNKHISKEVVLNDKLLDDCLTNLLAYFTTSLSLRIDPGLKILRARTYDKDKKATLIQDLSYIPIGMSHLSEIGRLNRKGSCVYYGCVHYGKASAALNVGFAETHSKTEQAVNILNSTSKEELQLYYLGIYNFVYRQQRPSFIPEDSFKAFEEVYEYERSVYTEEIFVAHQLCDAFISDVFRRTNTGYLYEVTSRLAEMIFKDTSSDGLIYGSVESEGRPLIALKPASVDLKLVHDSADVYEIEQSLGYGFYRAKHTWNGTLNGNNINWI